MTTDLGQCIELIYGNMGLGYQCSRKAKVVHERKAYCNQHSPAGQAKREEKFQEKLTRHRETDRKKYAAMSYDRKAGDYCRAKGLTIEELT